MVMPPLNPETVSKVKEQVDMTVENSEVGARRTSDSDSQYRTRRRDERDATRLQV